MSLHPELLGWEAKLQFCISTAPWAKGNPEFDLQGLGSGETPVTRSRALLLFELTLTYSGGSGLCSTNHELLCESGSQPHKWGSAQYLGLGFACMATIVLW